MEVEVCANGFKSAKVAQQADADRIELCRELSVGGLSPGPELIDKVMGEVDIPVHVLIRPRAGDFYYSDQEFEKMLGEVDYCRARGVSGIVCGLLTPDDDLDRVRMNIMLQRAGHLDFTFHRAIDVSSDPLSLLKGLVKLGVDRVLSSGQNASAEGGISLLKKMKALFGDHLQIMPGGGIDHRNTLLFKEAGFSAIHLSAIKKEYEAHTSLFNNPVSGHTDSGILKKVVQIAKP